MKTIRNILVCVTQQKTCERLIKKALTIKNEHNGNLYVLHVAKDSWNFLDNIKESEALEYLFTISKSAGANLTVLRSDAIVKTIAEFAKDKKIDYIIMGESNDDHTENRFFTALKQELVNTEVKIAPYD